MGQKLQDELRQSVPFVHPAAEALVSVLRTASVLEHAQNEVLRPYGLTRTQYNVLRVLQGAGSEGMCGRDVGERLISRVPDVSRLLDRMEEMGVIRRERSAADRRHVTAHITARGGKLLDAATPELLALAHERFDRLTPDTVEMLLDALSTVRDEG